MSKQHKKILSLIFLATFLAFTSLVGYCHIEWGADSDAFCPACKFQKASIAAGIAEIFQLPQPVEIDFVFPPSRPAHVVEVSVSHSARAPPLV